MMEEKGRTDDEREHKRRFKGDKRTSGFARNPNGRAGHSSRQFRRVDGEAEIRKICIYEDAVIFYDENTLKTAGMLELDYEALGIPDSMSSGEANRRLKTFIDSLDWLEAIIVHIETPIVNIPDNTEKIYEVQEG